MMSIRMSPCFYATLSPCANCNPKLPFFRRHFRSGQSIMHVKMPALFVIIDHARPQTPDRRGRWDKRGKFMRKLGNFHPLTRRSCTKEKSWKFSGVRTLLLVERKKKFFLRLDLHRIPHFRQVGSPGWFKICRGHAENFPPTIGIKRLSFFLESHKKTEGEFRFLLLSIGINRDY